MIAEPRSGPKLGGKKEAGRKKIGREKKPRLRNRKKKRKEKLQQILTALRARPLISLRGVSQIGLLAGPQTSKPYPGPQIHTSHPKLDLKIQTGNLELDHKFK